MIKVKNKIGDYFMQYKEIAEILNNLSDRPLSPEDMFRTLYNIARSTNATPRAVQRTVKQITHT